MREKIDYIYYRCYRFQVAVGNGSTAIAFSFLFLSFLLMLNFFSIAFILYAFFGLKLPFENPVAGGLVITGIIFLINFFLFIYNNRYAKILKTYKSETEIKIRDGNIKVAMYMILSFIMIGVSFWLMIMRNRGLL